MSLINTVFYWSILSRGKVLLNRWEVSGIGESLACSLWALAVLDRARCSGVLFHCAAKAKEELPMR